MKREREIYIVTGAGSIVNVVLFAFKLIAGILGKSSAMIADAVHSLSDLLTDIIIIVFVKLSTKPADKTHSYGHGKFETLATLLVAIILILVGIGIMVDGGDKIIKIISGENLPKPRMIALWAAIISILLKEILFRWTLSEGKKLGSSAVIANAWHHRSDSLSSFGTALGIGGAILFGGKWVILDPIAAIFVSFFILKVGIDIMKPCADELLERALPEAVRKEIVTSVHSVPGVIKTKRLMTRRIGMRYAIEFELFLDAGLTLGEACDKCNEIEGVLKRKFGRNTHVGIRLKTEKNDKKFN